MHLLGKGKAKDGGKGQWKAKVIAKGNGKTGDKGKADEAATKRSRKQAKLIDNSGMKPKYPQHDAFVGFESVHLELGMEFADLKSFKNVVKDYTIQLGRQIR